MNLLKSLPIFAAALLLLLSFWPNTAHSFAPPSQPRLPNFDKRQDGAAKEQRLSEAGAAAAERLRARVPRLRIDLDEVLGTPKLVGSPDGFLSGPNGEGRGISPDKARALPAHDPHRALKAFLNEHAAMFGHGAEVLASARIKRDYVTAHNGLHTTVWEQHLENVSVFEGLLISHVTRRGELVNVSSRLFPNLAKAAGVGVLQQRAAWLAAPNVAVTEAIAVAAKSVGEGLAVAEVSAVDAGPVGAEKRQRFKAGTLPGETRTRLVWLPIDRSTLRLCWEIDLTRHQGGESYRLLIDARTGEVLVRRCLTFYLSDATYRVYTGDSPSPFSPGYPTPTTNQPPLVPRSLVTLSAVDTNASPIGWISDGENETRGNNVDAHLDRNADNQPDLPRPQGSPFRVFDFPLDLTQPPERYGDASVVQLFYWCNWMHDKLYELGFTEAAGNYQKDNFGRGGLGDDAIQADAQDGSGVNNSNFTPAPDGTAGRVQMYGFTFTQPYRDGALDATVILHECTHGLSDRLIGGGAGIYQLQTEGMAEGWSDWYALTLLSKEGDDVDGNYLEGGYVTFEFSGLTQNYYFGIRHYPYTTDMTKNPLTLKDIDPAQISPHPGVPTNPIYTFSPKGAAEVHHQGEVWCVTLWDARANLIRKYGFAAGRQLILQLVTDGLKLSPPNPTFLQARDAILQADLVDTGGANQNELWAAFAKRGMGLNALVPPNWSTEGVAEAFNAPDVLSIMPGGALTFSGPAGGPLLPACRSYLLTNGTAAALAWQVSDAPLWIDVSPVSGILAAGTGTNVTLCLNTNANGLSVGNYSGTVTFSNATSGFVQARDLQLQVLDFAAMPFAEDFESGALQPYWQVTGTGSFRAEVRSDNEPHGGSYHLLMDSAADGYPARNEVTLGIDLAGYTNVTLQFWAKSFNDAPDGPPPAPFLDGADFDGVAISQDGVRWFEVQGLRLLNDTYAEFVVDLDSAIARLGLSYNSTFRIRFNQFGNHSIPYSGIAIDDVSITGFAPRLFAVNVPPKATEGDGVLAGQGRVSLPVAVTTNLTVNLMSSDTSSVTVPATVTVSAGGTEATFDLTIIDDSLLNGSRAAKITASAPGYTSGRATIRIDDNETAILTLTLPGSAQEGDGTLSTPGVVTADQAPATDVPINLVVSDSAKVQVPSPILLLAGLTNASFQLNILDNNAIDGTEVVVITASVPNWSSASAAITIFDNETTDLALSLPALLSEDNGVLPNAGAVQLSGTLDHDQLVSLVSDDTNKIIVPASVKIPAGRTTATFNLELGGGLVVDGSQIITISASSPGFTGASAALRLLDNATPPLPYAPQPRHLSVSNSLAAVLSWSFGVPSLVNNGDFETGGFDGWQKENSGDGDFIINDGSVNPPGSEGPVLPFAGGFSAVSQQTGPGQHTLFQDIDIPLFVDSIVLDWTDRIRNHAPQFSDRHGFRVEIRSTNDEFVALAFSTEPGDPLLSEWTERTFDLSDFRGLSIRIAFVEEDSLGFLNVYLDNVRILLGFPGEVTAEVYFTTNALPASADLLGVTTNMTWATPPLALATTYYWQIVTRRDAASTVGPVWQFTTRGVGPVDHFAWSPIAATQWVDAPFPATLAARDDLENTVTNFEGPVALTGTRLDRGEPVHVLSFVAFAEELDHRHALAAISANFTNYFETKTTALDPISLQSQLLSQDVFLVLPQLNAPPGQMAALGAAWANVLSNFVRSGGIVIACSSGGTEHSLLVSSGLLSLGKAGFSFVSDVTSPSQHQLTEGVLVPFTAYHLGLYNVTNAITVLQTVSGSNAVVASRDLGAGHVVMIGTDFATNRTGMDRILANAVKWSPAGRPAGIRLQPGFSDYFENGLWTGALVVRDIGSGFSLRADDGAGHSGLSNPFDVSGANDLSVRIASSPDPLWLGDNIVYTITVANSGPAIANNVIARDNLSAAFMFVSATTSQGTAVLTNATLVCQLGALAGGSSAVVQMVATPIKAGKIFNAVSVTSDAPETYTANNAAALVTRVEVPSLAIADTRTFDGDSGTHGAVLTVGLFPPSGLTVSCSYATADRSAIGGIDYVPTAGTLAFSPGVTNQTITVPVIGNTLNEPIKAFQVNLFNPTNAAIGRSLGLGVIFNDDPAPALAITSASVMEGDAGTTTNAVFNVSLSAVSGQTVTVNYATQDGTATGILDYLPTSGTLSFPPGATNQTFAVVVIGDNVAEHDETFFVNLSNPTNATLAGAQGTGTILDDDAGRIDHFAWAAIDRQQFYNVPFAATVMAQDGLNNPASSFNGTVALSGLVPQPDVLIGTNTDSWEYPMGTHYHDERLQAIYLAGEVGGPARITSLALQVAAPPGQTLTNWTIRLKHTPLSSYAAPLWEDRGWLTVYQNDEIVIHSGWVVFPFTAPFDFDGADNLMVDLSFNNSTYSSDGLCGFSVTDRPRAIYFRTDSAFGDPLAWSGAQNPPPITTKRIPNLKLATEKAVPISPADSGNFMNGVWAGPLAVNAPGTGITLRANDGLGHTGVSSPFTVTALNDLGVTIVDSPSPVRLHEMLTYTLTITNTGPTSANDVRLIDMLPASLNLVSVAASQGSSVTASNLVICELGGVAGGGRAVVTIIGIPNAAGMITNRASVTRREPDPFAGNNLATAVTKVLPPTLSITDASVKEGDSGTTNAVFNVFLSTVSTQPVSVDFFTAAGSSTADVDYLSTNGTLVFPPGATNQSFAVAVVGDTIYEGNETFTVKLTNSVNAGIGKGSGVGTILDDDPPPSITIDDVAVLEGNSGTTRAAFRVHLSAPSELLVSVNYATSNGTAMAGSDYHAQSGLLFFPPGFTNRFINVTVNGDLMIEPDETFFVNLSRPVNATIARGQAQGTILNDDGLAGVFDHLEWSTVPPMQYVDQPFPVSISARDFADGPATNFTGPVALTGRTGRPDVPIGTGGSAWPFPLATGYHDARTQVIYLTNEIGGSGRIVALGLDVLLIPGQTMNNFTIRLKHTPLNRYTAPAWETSDWTTVYQANQSVVSNGPASFLFATPFDYNGTNNLMVDLSFNNFYFTTDGSCRSTATGVARALAAQNDGEFGDPLNWSGATAPVPAANSIIPNLRLAFGFPVPITPTNSGNFVNGVWQGNLAVHQPATNLFLGADDGNGHNALSGLFSVLVNPDTNGNGLPDEWEIRYFGSLNAPNGGPNDDPDGDGATNLQEYLAGTNPLDPADVFKITSVRILGADVSISFTTVAAHHYRVERTADLAGGVWAAVADNLAGTGGILQVSDVNGTSQPQRFYRVRLLP